MGLNSNLAALRNTKVLTDLQRLVPKLDLSSKASVVRKKGQLKPLGSPKLQEESVISEMQYRYIPWDSEQLPNNYSINFQLTGRRVTFAQVGYSPLGNGAKKIMVSPDSAKGHHIHVPKIISGEKSIFKNERVNVSIMKDYQKERPGMLIQPSQLKSPQLWKADPLNKRLTQKQILLMNPPEFSLLPETLISEITMRTARIKKPNYDTVK